MNLLANAIALLTLLLTGAALLYHLAIHQPNGLQVREHLQNPVVWLFYAEDSPFNRSRTIQTARLWARLAPLPPLAQQVFIDSTGDLFTKKYVIHFRASPKAIAQWLIDSPETRATDPEILEDGRQLYGIVPRDAAFAEVVVSADHTAVTIKTAWAGGEPLPGGG